MHSSLRFLLLVMTLVRLRCADLHWNVLWALYGVNIPCKSYYKLYDCKALLIGMTDVTNFSWRMAFSPLLAAMEHHYKWLTYCCCMHSRLVPSILQQWPPAQLTQQSTWSHMRSIIGVVESEHQCSTCGCNLSPCSGLLATPELVVNAAWHLKFTCSTTWGCDINTKHQACNSTNHYDTIKSSYIGIKRCLQDSRQLHGFAIWHINPAFAACKECVLTCVKRNLIHFLSLWCCEMLHVHAVTPYCQ